MAKTNSPELLKAKDPATSPAELQELAKLRVTAVRREVAKNPNTPLKTLFALGEEFPREILENPTLPLLMLENPKITEEIPEKSFARLMQLEELPEYFFTTATPTACYNAVKLKKTPLRTLERLADRDSVYVREAIAKHPNVSEALLEKLSKDPNSSVLLVVAESPKTSAKVLDWLADTPDAKVTQQVAKNSNTSPESLQRLLSSTYNNTRYFALQNPNHPKDFQLAYQGLFQRESPHTYKARGLSAAQRGELLTSGLLARLFVASDTDTPPEILEQLSESTYRADKESEIAATIARNPSCPAALLEKFSTDKRAKIRESLLQNPVLSFTMMERLVEDQAPNVRMALCWRKDPPPSLLEKLAVDPDLYVRYYTAKNESTSAPLLAVLAKDRDPKVRENAATHENIAQETIALLAKDTDAKVRAAIARNKNTPLDILRAMVNDAEPEVTRALLNNPLFPVELIEELKGAKKELAQSSRKEVKELAATNDDWRTRKKLAEGYDTSVDLLTMLASDKIASVRTAVALHRNTPNEVVDALCKDKDTTVQTTALARSLNWNKEPSPALFSTLVNSRNTFAQERAAREPKLPPSLQKNLSSSGHSEVVRALAKREDLLPEIAAALSKHYNEQVRMEVASNPNTPPEVFASLSSSPDEWVRYRVASNSKTPAEVLATLGKDRSYQVRRAVAGNRRAPKELLLALSSDSSEKTREAAKFNLSVPRINNEH